MATKPIDGAGNTLYPEWASQDQQEVQDVNNNGNFLVIDNKSPTTEEWKKSGVEFKQNLPYDYVNWQFDLIYKWIKYQNEGQVGDYKIMATTDTATSVNARFGGNWVDVGTDTIAGETIRLFKKTV